MNSAIQEGRTWVIAIIVAVIFSSLIGEVTTDFPFNRSSSDIILTGVGWALVVVPCYFLCQGHGWAKWVLGVLLAISAFINIPLALIAIRSLFVSSALGLIPAAIDLISSWVLLGSPQIKAFSSSQRTELVISSFHY
ncbi:hypothetical protein IFO70_35300 [Phormidium tenue FACHB-886]|nr:hypothetical protein [Phormidium tenue FACHB-886]